MVLSGQLLTVASCVRSFCWVQKWRDGPIIASRQCPTINDKRCASRKAVLQRRGRTLQSMVTDTSVLTSKACSALIDCNSSLPEGKCRRRRQTAGESSFSVRQTSRQFHIHLCATWGWLNPQDYGIEMCSVHRAQIFHLFKPETWPTISSHWFVCLLISHIYFTHLTWSSWYTCPVALK